MRILHTIQSACPAGGGPIEALRQLAALAVTSGHRVEVVSLDPPDAAFLASFPLPIHALGPSRLGYGYASCVVPWLRANAKNYDVVVVNGLWQYLSFACWQVLHGTTTPYVVYTHGMLDPWFKRRYPLKHLKKLLYWPLGEYRVLRDAAAVLFTCEEERLLARQSFRLYKAKERVVAFGTRGPVGNELQQKQQFQVQFPETKGKRLLLYMSRIHPKKGCDLVIQAFGAVLASDPGWHLVVAGPDQVGWRPTLLRLAREMDLTDRITWTGMLRADMKWGALHSAEALFLPSHQENFGIVVAEALSCGVPVLISNRVNIWREIEEDGAGLVAEDTFEGARSVLAAWVEMTVDDRADMRERTRRCFQERFEIQKASDSLLNVLSALHAV
jgi:glycosyltransferase involved in cell wall biosynthesis